MKYLHFADVGTRCIQSSDYNYSIALSVRSADLNTLNCTKMIASSAIVPNDPISQGKVVST